MLALAGGRFGAAVISLMSAPFIAYLFESSDSGVAAFFCRGHHARFSGIAPVLPERNIYSKRRERHQGDRAPELSCRIHVSGRVRIFLRVRSLDAPRPKSSAIAVFVSRSIEAAWNIQVFSIPRVWLSSER